MDRVKITQSDLAKQSGVSQATISRILSGVFGVSRRTAMLLAGPLKTGPGYLTFDEADPTIIESEARYQARPQELPDCCRLARDHPELVAGLVEMHSLGAGAILDHLAEQVRLFLPSARAESGRRRRSR